MSHKVTITIEFTIEFEVEDPELIKLPNWKMDHDELLTDCFISEATLDGEELKNPHGDGDGYLAWEDS